MDPMIREFPSNTFYEGRITDSDSIATRTISTLVQAMGRVFQKLAFFDLLNSCESQDETSKTNREEVCFILNLLSMLFNKLAGGNMSHLKGRIGIITPYKAQVRLLKDLVGDWLRQKGLYTGSLKLNDFVEVNTVDAF